MPGARVEATKKFRTLVAPAVVGVTGLGMKAGKTGTELPHAKPDGRPEQDSVTG